MHQVARFFCLEHIFSKLSARFVVRLAFTALLPLSESLPASAEAAFAYGRDASGRLIYGAASNVNTQQEASALAMRRCAGLGFNCQIVRQFHMGCFAFASSINGAGGFGTDAVKINAESRAVSECSHRSSGQQCSVQNSFCDAVSEPLIVALRGAEQERREQLGRDSSGNAAQCSLNGKAISYHSQLCAVGAACRDTLGYLEIIGDKVLSQQNSERANSGVVFQLGRSNEVSNDLSQLPAAYSAVPAYNRGEATASFDGSELDLRVDFASHTASNTYFPKDTLLAVSTLLERISVENCSRCAVLTVTNKLQTFSGFGNTIAKSGPNPNISCDLTSMQ